MVEVEEVRARVKRVHIVRLLRRFRMKQICCHIVGLVFKLS